MQKYWLFHLTLFIYESAKKPDEKKSKEDEQTLAELNLAHRRSQAKCQYKPVILNKLNCLTSHGLGHPGLLIKAKYGLRVFELGYKDKTYLFHEWQNYFTVIDWNQVILSLFFLSVALLCKLTGARA